MIMKTLGLIIAIVIEYAGTESVSYNNGGSDWGTECTASGLNRQSPIDIEDIKGYNFFL